MRRTASEIIRNLEMRIARLENRSASTQRKAGPGAGVEICLSGKSRNSRCMTPNLDINLKAKMDRNGDLKILGTIDIEDVTISSYYNSKDVDGYFGEIVGKDIDLETALDYDDEISSVKFTGHCELENTMEGGGSTRGSAPGRIDVEGELEVEISFEDGDYIVEMIPFTATAKTSDEFELMYDTLDDQ